VEPPAKTLSAERVVPMQPAPLFYADHFAARGVDLFRAVCARDLEGIVAKRKDGPIHSRGDLVGEGQQAELQPGRGAARVFRQGGRWRLNRTTGSAPRVVLLTATCTPNEPAVGRAGLPRARLGLRPNGSPILPRLSVLIVPWRGFRGGIGADLSEWPPERGDAP
jgi:hypothetical protein